MGKNRNVRTCVLAVRDINPAAGPNSYLANRDMHSLLRMDHVVATSTTGS